MAAEVEYNSMDRLQAAHTWSGVEIALWDLLGHQRGEPVWRVLCHVASHPNAPGLCNANANVIRIVAATSAGAIPAARFV